MTDDASTCYRSTAAAAAAGSAVRYLSYSSFKSPPPLLIHLVSEAAPCYGMTTTTMHSFKDRG